MQHRDHRLLPVVLFVLCTALACDAELQSFEIDSRVAAPDLEVGDGECVALVDLLDTASGPWPVFGCTLQAALQEANAYSGTTHIQIPDSLPSLRLPEAGFVIVGDVQIFGLDESDDEDAEISGHLILQGATVGIENVVLTASSLALPASPCVDVTESSSLLLRGVMMGLRSFPRVRPRRLLHDAGDRELRDPAAREWDLRDLRTARLPARRGRERPPRARRLPARVRQSGAGPEPPVLVLRRRSSRAAALSRPTPRRGRPGLRVPPLRGSLRRRATCARREPLPAAERARGHLPLPGQRLALAPPRLPVLLRAALQPAQRDPDRLPCRGRALSRLTSRSSAGLACRATLCRAEMLRALGSNPRPPGSKPGALNGVGLARGAVTGARAGDGAGRRRAPYRRTRGRAEERATVASDPNTLLSPRQLEVLELMAKGLTNREIAGVLSISANTVKTHVAAVIDALDVTNRTEAAVALEELGLGSRSGAADDAYRVNGFGDRPTIAVLPFDDMSDGGTRGYPRIRPDIRLPTKPRPAPSRAASG